MTIGEMFIVWITVSVIVCIVIGYSIAIMGGTKK